MKNKTTEATHVCLDYEHNGKCRICNKAVFPSKQLSLNTTLNNE